MRGHVRDHRPIELNVVGVPLSTSFALSGGGGLCVRKYRGRLEVPSIKPDSSGFFQATQAEKAMNQGMNAALMPSKIGHLGPGESSFPAALALATRLIKMMAMQLWPFGTLPHRGKHAASSIRAPRSIARMVCDCDITVFSLEYATDQLSGSRLRRSTSASTMLNGE